MKNARHARRVRQLEYSRKRRRLQFEHLECRYVLNGDAVLAPDYFSLHQNGPQTPLNILANDVFAADYSGARVITSLSYGSQGGRLQIAPDHRSVLYTPPADFFGSESFQYAVDGQFASQVDVTIQSPLAFDHFSFVPDGTAHQLNLLDNDPFWQDYTGAKRITSISVGSAGGALAINPDGKSVRYTAPNDGTKYETFTYIVDNIYPAQVTVNIAAPLDNDNYELVQHSDTSLDVLANDPFWAAYTGERRITHITASQAAGAVTIASDGKSLLYTAGNGPSQDVFRYVVDGKYEATVYVAVRRPVADDDLSIDENTSDFYFDVLQNDYYTDNSGHHQDVVDRVTAVTQPTNGSVAIAPDGKGISYTANSGFIGNDTFTYTADGVHVATVRVQVTNPVRNDCLDHSIYQDMAGTLDVLANDFVGNGYQGPRQITAVGATHNGGVASIAADGKTINYTPAPGFVGQDWFTYTVDGVFETDARIVVQPLAQYDYFEFNPAPGHAPYELRVKENDHFYNGYMGLGAITNVQLVRGNGQVTIKDPWTLLFTPSQAGGYTIRYTVDGKYEAEVGVSISNAVYDDHAVADQNAGPQSVSVLANDFRIYSGHSYYGYYDYYSGPGLVTGATQSQHGGVVTIDPGSRAVHYTPPVDFVGADSFTYTVDGFMTATVSVDVIRRVRDDQYRVDAADGPQLLAVLANDLLSADHQGPGQISAVSATAFGGAVTIANDGHAIIYQPAAGFTGTDKFTYTVDGRFKAEVSVVVDTPASTQAPKFANLDEYIQFLIDDALDRYKDWFGQHEWYYPAYPYLTLTTNDAAVNFSATDARNHSETNVQTAGVDEGDIVEFDSNYIYTLTENGVTIVSAWPANGMRVASEFNIDGRPVAEYLHGDRLTVISQSGGTWYNPYFTNDLVIGGYWGGSQYTPASTIVTVIDVSDRAHPTLVQKTTMDGAYVDSRAVGDFVYTLVDNRSAIAPKPQIIDTDNDPTTPGRYETRAEFLARVTTNKGAFAEAVLPSYTSYGADGELARTGLLATPEKIYQPLVDKAIDLLSVVSFNVTSNVPGLAATSAVYSTGASTIYASLDNFYVFDNDYSVEDGAITRIMKFDWDPSTGGVDFVATTTVAGRMLNQFSADASGSYLRIATTVSNHGSGNWTGRDDNMLFVLQEDGGVFEYVGSMQNLALNESIYSVRFLGDRAFISTFRVIDPLFAIDLSDPAHPESLGHITLPGFSTYIQLIDANHLVTVGHNTPGTFGGPVQVSLFNISDLTAPLRIAEYSFERFSASEAAFDHHAFAYYAELGLLSMPVATTRYQRVDSDGDGYRESTELVQASQLAIFSIDVNATDPTQLLTLKGQIDHDSRVRRSGFIGDKLYSIATGDIKAIDISAPDTVIGAVELPQPQAPPPPPLTGVLQPFIFTSKPPVVAEAPPPTSQDRLSAAAERARSALAATLSVAAGAPLLITAETTSDALGDGYAFVFLVDSQQYLYRANDADLVQLIEDNYEFPDTGAWRQISPHSNSTTTTPKATTPPSETPAMAPGRSERGEEQPPTTIVVQPQRPPSESAETEFALAENPATATSTIEPIHSASRMPPSAAIDQAIIELPRYTRSAERSAYRPTIRSTHEASSMDRNLLYALANAAFDDLAGSSSSPHGTLSFEDDSIGAHTGSFEQQLWNSVEDSLAHEVATVGRLQWAIAY